MSSSLGNVEDRSEGDLSLSGEVNMSEGLIAVLAEALVECIVVLLFNVLGSSEPDGFVVVHCFPVVHGLVYYLYFRLLIILILDLDVIVGFSFFGFGFLFLLDWFLDLNRKFVKNVVKHIPKYIGLRFTASSTYNELTLIEIQYRVFYTVMVEQYLYTVTQAHEYNYIYPTIKHGYWLTIRNS